MMSVSNLYLVITNISAWWATSDIPGPGDWVIGGNGILTCNYGPESVFSLYRYVEWTYQAPNATSFTPVYYYIPSGRNITYEHLKDRATHVQTSTQMKLIIINTVSTDDGIYKGKIQGNDTAICEVNYTTQGNNSIKVFVETNRMQLEISN